MQLVTSAKVCAQFGTPLVQHGGSPNSVSINRVDSAVKSYGAERRAVPTQKTAFEPTSCSIGQTATPSASRFFFVHFVFHNLLLTIRAGPR